MSRTVRLMLAALVALVLSASSLIATAPSASALPIDILSYSASGTYLKKLDGLKIGLYIPAHKKNGTTLGKTYLKQDIMGGDVEFKATFTRANSARFNAVLYETPMVQRYINTDDTKRHIEVYCDSVRIGSKWVVVDPDTGKAYFWKVAGQKTTFRAKFYAVLKYYDLDNDVWKVQEQGYFYTHTQTISWVKKK
mgnify:CR=1 FL=1